MPSLPNDARMSDAEALALCSPDTRAVFDRMDALASRLALVEAPGRVPPVLVEGGRPRASAKPR